MFYDQGGLDVTWYNLLHTARIYDDEGQELFISMEGVPLREPEITAKQIITQLKNFSIYLLGASNTMIGKIVSNAFDVIAPPARVSVFWIHELQRTEAVFQNMLSTNRHAVGHNLVSAMKRQLTNFDDFATFRQSTSIAYSLWELANGMQYDQQTGDSELSGLPNRLSTSWRPPISLMLVSSETSSSRPLAGFRPRIYAADKFLRST